MSAKKLPKNVLTANLLALAAANTTTDNDHRVRFDFLLARIRKALSVAEGPEVIHECGLNTDFVEALRIAKDHLRMSPTEFESAVSDLNGAFSRVVNLCPCGRDPRDLPDYLKMTNDEIRFPFDLRTPFDAALFIVRYGKMWGYSESQVLKAEGDFRKLDRVRRAKVAEADEARAAVRRAEIEAQSAEMGRRRREYEATNPPVPDYVLNEREWRHKMRNQKDFVGVEVIFED